MTEAQIVQLVLSILGILSGVGAGLHSINTRTQVKVAQATSAVVNRTPPPGSIVPPGTPSAPVGLPASPALAADIQKVLQGTAKIVPIAEEAVAGFRTGA